MALLDSAILLLCSHTHAYAPCKASLLAASKQSGVYEISASVEHRATTSVQKNATDTFGQNTVIAFGVAAILVKAIQNKGMDFGLPTLGVCDSLNVHAGITSYGLRMGWKF